jgi:hypothetical protein
MAKRTTKQRPADETPPAMVENPYVVVFPGDGSVTTIIDAAHPLGHELFGFIICDLVGHVAQTFGVTEATVWRYVDFERNNPSRDRRPTKLVVTGLTQ